MKILFVLLCVSQFALAKVTFPTEAGTPPPELLSQTGLFVGEVSKLEPSPELRPYSINQPLWVDYAKKKRWVFLPEGTQITFNADGPWAFPVGTIIIKHFDMEVSKGVFQKIETRILVHQKSEKEQDWIGYAYQWEGDDAKLVPNGQRPTVTLNVHASAPGGERTQEYQIPSRSDCLQCHHSSVGFVRSVRTEQLNRMEGEENQLRQWETAGVFQNKIGDLSLLKAFGSIKDKELDLEHRVKSYLSVNCAHCHNPDPTARCAFIGIDFRYDFINKTELIDFGYLVPGSAEESEIFLRMESEQPFFRMPYIGTKLKHPKAVEVLKEWIDNQ